MSNQLKAKPHTNNKPIANENALFRNDQLRSQNGTFQLILQESDGNLVLYIDDPTKDRNSGLINRAIWSAYTENDTIGYAVMQDDGNFVVYDDDQNAFFDTQTSGHPGAFLILQDDGNLVVYASDGQTPLWQSGTSAGEAPGVNAS